MSEDKDEEERREKTEKRRGEEERKQQQKSSKQAKLAFLRSFQCGGVGDEGTKLVSFIIINLTFDVF